MTATDNPHKLCRKALIAYAREDKTEPDKETGRSWWPEGTGQYVYIKRCIMANIFNADFVSSVKASIESLLDSKQPAIRSAVADAVGLDGTDKDDCALVAQVVARELTEYNARQKSGWVRAGTPKAASKKSKNPGVRDAITAKCKELNLDPTDVKVRAKVGAALRGDKLVGGAAA